MYYEWKDGEGTSGQQTGLIAQEVNEVVPEVVTYAEDVDRYGIEYGHLSGVLIESIKELTLKVQTLNNKIKELEGK